MLITKVNFILGVFFGIFIALSLSWFGHIMITLNHCKKKNIVVASFKWIPSGSTPEKKLKPVEQKKERLLNPSLNYHSNDTLDYTPIKKSLGSKNSNPSTITFP